MIIVQVIISQDFDDIESEIKGEPSIHELSDFDKKKLYLICQKEIYHLFDMARVAERQTRET